MDHCVCVNHCTCMYKPQHIYFAYKPQYISRYEVRVINHSTYLDMRLG